MIGNDIIDFEFAKRHSRWKEQRFLDKLFSAEEQGFILSEGKRFENIWRLWSMKESAYKIMSRADGIIRFNPKDFECSITNAISGIVVSQNRSISTYTEMNSKFVQTTAFFNNNWRSEVFPLQYSDAKSQHRETYQHVIKAYANLKFQTPDAVKIIKNCLGIPQFYINGILQIDRLSLTHHGHFAAWAIAFQ